MKNQKPQSPAEILEAHLLKNNLATPEEIEQAKSEADKRIKELNSKDKTMERISTSEIYELPVDIEVPEVVSQHCALMHILQFHHGTMLTGQRIRIEQQDRIVVYENANNGWNEVAQAPSKFVMEMTNEERDEYFSDDD